jgi:hypothetical protein
MTSMASQSGGLAAAAAMSRVVSDFLALPMDIARERYAKAVKAGLIERSLLKSALFGQRLNAFEKLMLGPMARKC